MFNATVREMNHTIRGPLQAGYQEGSALPRATFTRFYATVAGGRTLTAVNLYLRIPKLSLQAC
jgi:hypothetical protein